jgi:uncharacterized protein YraI
MERLAKQTLRLIVAVIVCFGLAYLIAHYVGFTLLYWLVAGGAGLMLIVERALPAWNPLLSWAFFGAIIGLVVALCREAERRGKTNSRRFLVFVLLTGLIWWVGEANGWFAVIPQLKQALNIKSRPNEEAGAEANWATVVAPQGATVRSGPSTSARRLGKLPNKQRVNILAQSGDWYEIASDGLRGYMHQSLLSISSGMPATSNTMESGMPSSEPTQAQVVIRSIPSGASITVNGQTMGSAPVTYMAKPQEKLTIKFEAPDFEPLEIERAAPAGGMTIVEYPLVPINFPFGTWVAQIGEKVGELELRRGQVGNLQAKLIIENNGQEVGSQIKLQGRYDPVQKTLSLNEIESAAARLKTVLSDDLKNMRGKLRFSDSDSTLSFEANWQEE